MTQAAARRSGVALGAIVLLALAVRTWGLGFGLPLVYARPDELLLIGNVVEFFTHGPNPGFFEYPTLYMYAIAGVYAIYCGVGLLTGRFESVAAFAASFRPHFQPFFLIPRAMSAVLGAATAAVVFGIGRALFAGSAPWLAAVFMALAFLHVRDSHYATTDVAMAFFTMCAMLAIVRVHRGRRAGDARLAGVLAGLAMGVKYNAVVLALPMLVVEVWHAWTLRREPRRIVRESHLLRMAVPFLLVFLAGSPYLVLDHQAALRDLSALQQSTSTGMTPPELLGRGWSYHLPYSLWYGVGWPMLVAAFAGLAMLSVRQPADAAVLAAFPAAYYLIAGAGYNVFVRYMIPVVPFICLFARYGVAQIGGFVASRLRVAAPAATALVGALVVAPSAWSVVQFDRLLAREDSRVIASRWVKEHVPAGATLYMSGNRYGHLELEQYGVPPRYRYFGFDHRTRRFTEHRREVDARPDWIVVQRSEIPYSHVPPAVEDLLAAEYALVHTVRAAADNTGNFYDIQDGFYLPFGGFRRVTRPGPNLFIYQRRQ